MAPRFLAEEPPALLGKLEPLYQDAAAAIDQQNWVAAIPPLRAAYGLLLSEQPDGHRFHKGWPLHNWGVALMASNGPTEEGINLILQAFIEDVLTYGEVGGDDPLAQPAGSVLGYVLIFPDDGLSRLKDEIVDRVRAGHLYPNPDALAEELVLGGTLAVRATAGSRRPRKPGQHQAEWQYRVFVGGSYQDNPVRLRDIEDVCRHRHFEAVVVADFDVPEKFIHDHSLMLLHECRWAVFEVSSPAGQLIELERALEYGIVPLVVHQGLVDTGGHVSAMVRSMLDRRSVHLEMYQTTDELRTLVDAYLDSAQESNRVDLGTMW